MQNRVLGSEICALDKADHYRKETTTWHQREMFNYEVGDEREGMKRTRGVNQKTRMFGRAPMIGGG